MGESSKNNSDIRISEYDQYLFGEGTHYEIFNKLGAHETCIDGKRGIYFAVWAPNAKAVNVIGEFNGWNEEANPMKRLEPLGIYEAFIESANLGTMYKYLIISKDNEKLYKADPYAFYAEMRPGTASIAADISNFAWGDSEWIKKREKTDPKKMPVSIYEVHPGS